MITFQNQPSESHQTPPWPAKQYEREQNQSTCLQTEDPLLEPPNLHQDWGQHQDQVRYIMSI